MTETQVDDRELMALLSLLETESGSSLSLMIEHVRTFDDATLGRLTTVAPSDSPAQSTLNLVLAEREAPRLQAAFLRWLADGADLETGVLLVSESGYPRLASGEVSSAIDALAGDVRGRLSHRDDVERLQRLIDFLARENDFHGTDDGYYDPDNSYLNRILERRRGLPISLSVLYILMGKRLGLEIRGIALPHHFIAGLFVPGNTVLFDPFHEGKLLSEADVAAIVGASGQTSQPEHLRPATSRQIVQRMLLNLLHAYDLHEELERAELVKQYLSVVAEPHG
ncbi:MAG: hypothetical protein NVS2B16_00970 [Chloroflexota bacterium]